MIEEIFLGEKVIPLDIDRDLAIIEGVFNYRGILGSICDKKKTVFKVWSPVATGIKLILYKGEKKEYIMKKELDGVWSIKIKGNLNGVEYTYLVEHLDGVFETTDPYCKNISNDGTKSLVVNMKKTNPKHWDNIKILKNPKSNIIYEMSIRDFTIDETRLIKESDRGKYKGLRSYKNNFKKVGIEHLVSLGVTHVQLMPIYDFTSGEENNFYNWGYNPKNYNVPEKTYSTGENVLSKIVELKEMIMNFHVNGIKVIMDVVYNHHTDAENSNFNKIVPKYYFRSNEYGNFSNGSGRGNEFATERNMARKFIVDSMAYWAEEYKIDGFRLDLMGLYDIETIQEIRKELDEINRDILLYGEPWKGGESALLDEISMVSKNMYKLESEEIGCFNDIFRDCTKGSVFDFTSKGFVSGEYGLEEKLKHCIVGSIKHKGIDYSKINKVNFLNESYQSINYDSCHDNHTLFDKLMLANYGVAEEEIIKMNLLTAAILLTSQGNCFINSGEEFLRTKVNKDGNFESNSYNSGDYVNKIDWERKDKYKDVVNYYKELINIRKKHKVFNINNSKKINECISFIDKSEFSSSENIVAYIIDGLKLGDDYKKVLIAFNGSRVNKEINLKEEGWDIILDGEHIRETGIEYIDGNILSVKALSALIAIKY